MVSSTSGALPLTRDSAMRKAAISPMSTFLAYCSRASLMFDQTFEGLIDYLPPISIWRPLC